MKDAYQRRSKIIHFKIRKRKKIEFFQESHNEIDDGEN